VSNRWLAQHDQAHNVHNLASLPYKGCIFSVEAYANIGKKGRVLPSTF
jgi:hypothetical protein